MRYSQAQSGLVPGSLECGDNFTNLSRLRQIERKGSKRRVFSVENKKDNNMKRIMMGTAVAVALLGSTAYAAGTSAPATIAAPPPGPMTTAAPPLAAPASMHDYAGECKELGTQWETAEAANASNAKLGKAKAKANAAEKSCASTKVSKEKAGISQFKAALKLLGVKPTT